jgi:hypothetical protein
MYAKLLKTILVVIAALCCVLGNSTAVCLPTFADDEE